jgi:phage gp29-like protein
LVPRRHVRPEYGMLILKQTDDKGPVYRGDAKLEQFLFEFGSNEDLGLLNKAIPHVLFSRFAQSAWSEFCEIFGMPVRYAKTNTKDINSLNRVEDMLINMATASYGVLDKDETLEFIESQKTNGDVYKGLMQMSSSKVAKLINGSVIGEATEKGSQAKETVGKEIQQDIFDGDKKWFESIMNEDILPKLINLGYPFADNFFEFDASKDINTEWTLVNGILQHYNVDPKYISENFGVPVTPKMAAAGKNGAQANASESFFD